ncbi:MAG: DUF721 domain-containing protein [Gammaproteobacteria bacterium]|nr:DUF721 domain-containing protein [Gammaproteobacteria bacterium]
MKGLTKISDVAAANSELRQLFEHVRGLRELEALLFLKLGTPLSRNFNVAAFHDDGALVLVARSALWATRLRYLAPELVTWAKTVRELRGIKSLQVYVGRFHPDSTRSVQPNPIRQS